MRESYCFVLSYQSDTARHDSPKSYCFVLSYYSDTARHDSTHYSLFCPHFSLLHASLINSFSTILFSIFHFQSLVQIEKMVYEASLADTENLKIRSEFSMRERQTTELIKKQEASLELLKKVTIERELTESSANYQRLEVQKIMAVNTELKLQNVALEDSVKQLEHEIVDMEIKLDRQKHLAAELKKLQTNLKNQKAENKKLVESTVELGQKILRETLALSDTLRANYSIKVSKMIAEDPDFS